MPPSVVYTLCLCLKWAIADHYPVRPWCIFAIGTEYGGVHIFSLLAHLRLTSGVSSWMKLIGSAHTRGATYL